MYSALKKNEASIFCLEVEKMTEVQWCSELEKKPGTAEMTEVEWRSGQEKR